MTTTVLRLLLAVMLGIAAAIGWRMYEARAARLAGDAPPPPASATDAAPAPAPGRLYRCVDAAGAASIQSAPCPAGSRTAWVRDTVPETGGEPSLVIDGTPRRWSDNAGERPRGRPTEQRLESLERLTSEPE